jgi:hypothetical protein
MSDLGLGFEIRYQIPEISLPASGGKFIHNPTSIIHN